MTNQDEVEERLANLESRIAFQDVTIEELNGVITKQQDQIDAMNEKLKELISQSKPSLVAKETEGDTPPHY